jgi:Ca2+-binding RTX toxin-like protein
MLERLDRRLVLSTSLSAGTLTITGTTGNDAVDVGQVGTNITVNENDGTGVKSFAGVARIVANLNNGNDRITVAAAVTKPTTLRGGAGNDTLTGGNGADAIFGEAGGDLLDGQLGNDQLNGGLNTDTVTYAARTTPITANINFTYPGGVPGTVGGSGGKTGETDTYTDIETLFGSTAADTLSVGGFTSTTPLTTLRFSLEGRDGNDTLSVSTQLLGPSDVRVTLRGGNGDDNFSIGDGGSTSPPIVNAFGDNNNDRFTYGDNFLPPMIIDGGAGIDTQVGSANASPISGSDTIVIPPGVENLLNARAATSITGNDLNNTIEAIAPLIDARGGNDVITSSVRFGNATVLGGAGNDSITFTGSFLGEGTAQLDGGDGNDSIVGSYLDELLLGGAGNDTLDGGATKDPNNPNNPAITGDDTLDGGTGTDTVDYSRRTAPITASLQLNNFAVPPGPGAPLQLIGGGGGEAGETDAFANDERILGSSADDKLSVSYLSEVAGRPAVQFVLEGRGGNDTLSSGGPGSIATALRVTLLGGEGNDSLSHAGVTGDTVVVNALGEAGNDTFTYGDLFLPPFTIDGGPGIDTQVSEANATPITGSPTAVTAPTGVENLSNVRSAVAIYGNSLDNVIEGTAPLIDGVAGNDRITGGTRFGVATLRGGAGDDVLIGVQSFDETSGVSLSGDSGNDSLVGTAKSDTLSGGDGNDTLTGNAGGDVLRGDAGNDRILARDTTKDTVDGGLGTDAAQVDTGSVADSVLSIETFLP